ncbi:uncharacterized protein LOC115387247 isoform X2 [Salarias fasciatus]|uniref:uncharacterized protein LOC115387247 isoform X2 n=1 Tax=Salarias fasciatus TaxID=181472 RepID=UPI001176A7EE|nr:uncharacterized protein LOC115387247 isoform X2 [Salarias fasciatus]
MALDERCRFCKELPQHYDCREEQLLEQEVNYCLQEEEPDPPRIKEEPEEPRLVQFKEEQDELGPPKIKEEEAEPPQREEEEPGISFPPAAEDVGDDAICDQQFQEDQEEPKPSQTEALCTKWEGERFILFESVPSAEEQSDLREAEEVPCNEQFLSGGSEAQDRKNCSDSKSRVNAEVKKLTYFIVTV